MTKAEIVNEIGRSTGIDKTEVLTVVESFMEEVKNAVAAGETVQLVGFGTFEARSRAAREARNPKTGETLKIAAKKVPAFKPGKAFKDAVNG